VKLSTKSAAAFFTVWLCVFATAYLLSGPVLAAPGDPSCGNCVFCEMFDTFESNGAGIGYTVQATTTPPVASAIGSQNIWKSPSCNEGGAPVDTNPAVYLTIWRFENLQLTCNMGGYEPPWTYYIEATNGTGPTVLSTGFVKKICQ
jgi:hypothetical protein